MSSDRTADKISSVTNSALFRRVVIALIVLNAIIVGLDTYPGTMSAYGEILHLVDRIILYLFSARVSPTFPWIAS